MPMTDLPISSAVCHAQRSTDWFQPCRSRYAVHSEKNAYQCRVVASSPRTSAGLGFAALKKRASFPVGPCTTRSSSPDFRLLKQIDQGRVPAVGRLADAATSSSESASSGPSNSTVSTRSNRLRKAASNE